MASLASSSYPILSWIWCRQREWWGRRGMIRIYRSNENGRCLEAGNKGFKRLRLKGAKIVGVLVESRREHI